MANSFLARRCIPRIALAWITLILVASAPPAVSQSPAQNCRVFDPELQGSYAGGCVGGFAEGFGEASGIAQYMGGFKAGKKHGRGVKTWPSSGDRYEGEFAEDRKDGTGVYKWGSRSPWTGEKYTGSYVNDLRQGYGAYEWPSGDHYFGPWVADMPSGAITPSMTARARAHLETVAAVAKPGIRVCRQMTVGIGTREWISGTVTAAIADTIAIRIDDAGQFGHVIFTRPVIKGGLVIDAAQHWLPC